MKKNFLLFCIWSLSFQVCIGMQDGAHNISQEHQLEQQIAQAMENRKAPLIDEEQVKFSVNVANIVNKYFKKPYEYASEEKLEYVDNKKQKHIVYRPNHSLAHGMRQAYLAVDIALFFAMAKMSDFQTKNSKNLWRYIRKEMGFEEGKIKFAKDKIENFLKKLEFANAFQRTGRKSEDSRGSNKDRYESYLKQDQKNFESEVKPYIGAHNLFKDIDEANKYKRAIFEVFGNDLKNKDGQKETDEEVVYLSKICFAAHLFDLRRLNNTLDRDKLFDEISKQLFEKNFSSLVSREHELFSKLWDRARDYLKATGDRDYEDPNRDWNKKVFYEQSVNPELMIEALQLVRAKSQESKLIESIIIHSQAIRDLKDEFNNKKIDVYKISENEKEKQRLEHIEEVIKGLYGWNEKDNNGKLGQEIEEKIKKSEELRKTLKNAPYTASEGYLKILLGKNYISIPQNESSEENIRKIIEKNVRVFLSKKIEDRNIEEAILDDGYINILVDCMMEERKPENRGKLVFYHATNPEFGLLYDIYSELRNQLIMEGKDATRTLRAIDIDFLKLDESLTTKKATVNQLIEKLGNKRDDDVVGYQDIGLFTNFGLFGSDPSPSDATYIMFLNSKKESVSVTPPNYNTLFNKIVFHTGIHGDYKLYKEIYDKYASSPLSKNGRLIQIFVDPSVANEISHPSIIYGQPLRDKESNNVLTIAPFVERLRTSPDTFDAYLKNTNAYEEENVKVCDLQSPMFIRPEIMHDPQVVSVKSYWRVSKPKAEYYSEIKKQVNKSLVKWLKQGGASHPNAFASNTEKLRKITQYIHKGTTGLEAPKAPPLTLEAQFANLLEGKNFNEAAEILKQNERTLRGKTFTLSTGKNFTLEEIIEKYPSIPIIEAAIDVNLLKGGREVKEFLKDEKNINDTSIIKKFIRIISNPKIKKGISLFNEYFANIKWESFDYKLGVLESIIKNVVDDDTSILEYSKPLIRLLDNDFPGNIFRFIKDIPTEQREELIQETINFINLLKDKNKYRQAGYILRDIQELTLKNLEVKKKNLIKDLVLNTFNKYGLRFNLLPGIAELTDSELTMLKQVLDLPCSPTFSTIMKKIKSLLSSIAIIDSSDDRYRQMIDKRMKEIIDEKNN